MEKHHTTQVKDALLPAQPRALEVGSVEVINNEEYKTTIYIYIYIYRMTKTVSAGQTVARCGGMRGNMC